MRLFLKQGVDLAAVVGPHAVLVAVEAGEAVGVGPHALVGGVEQVRAVAVDLDAGGPVRAGVLMTSARISSLPNKCLRHRCTGAAQNRF